MGDPEGSFANSPILKDLIASYGVFGAVVFGILVPLLFSIMLVGKKKVKQRGVPVEVGGEPGFAMRNSRYTELVEVPWEGATTIAALFEQSCRKHPQDPFLGTRKLIGREFVMSSDGRKFEKLHLGEYHWETYEEIFDRACNFASGLIKLGHDTDGHVAIFSDTQAEWLIAFQVAMLILIYIYILLSGLNM